MSLFDRGKGSPTSEEVGPSGVEPVDEAADQPQADKKLAAFIKEKVDESRRSSSRISNEGVWMTNIAYLLGFYGVYFDTTLRQYQPAQNNNTSYMVRNKLQVNKILPTIQNRLARLCKNPPKYEVRPNSNECHDKEAATLALQVLNYIMDKEKATTKRQELYMWMQEIGHSYIKVVWDDQSGEPMYDPETDEMIGYEGDVKLEVVPGLEVFPDPLAKNLEECQWIAQAKLRKLDYFKTHYPERGDTVKEEGVWLLSTQYETRINSLNVRGQGSTGSQTIAKNSAIEIVYYERRSLKYPNGRMIVTANGVLLMDKDLPCGEIPLVKFDDVLIGGKYYSESLITHIRPLQDQFNRLYSQRTEWVNKILAGKYLAPKGHGIIQESFDDRSGEIIEYNPGPQGQKPEALQTPMIPSYAYQEEDRLQGSMFDISGINEISRGQVPTAGIPAIGMQFLMEQDDTRIGIVTENNENGWAAVGSLVLKLVEKNYVLERLIKIAGPRLEYTVKSLVGKDIRHNTDVMVIRGSTLPGSKVLKRQEILNLRSQGLFGNPNDPQVIQKVMDMLEYGDSYLAWEEQGIDMVQIENDIELIEQEVIPELNEFDNHELHIRRKNLYRKSDKIKKLSDTAMKILIFDIERRVQLLTLSRNPQLGAQAQQIAMAQDKLTQHKAMVMANSGNLTSGNVPGAQMPPPMAGPPMQGPPPPQQ